MATYGNYKRKTYLAEVVPGETTPPSDEKWLRLAAKTATMDDNSDEDTNDDAFYDTGVPTNAVTNVRIGWSMSGQYDHEDPAQQLVESKRWLDGDDRHVWLKVVSADGKKQVVGMANITDPHFGFGDAGDNESFEFDIQFIQKVQPEDVPATPGK